MITLDQIRARLEARDCRFPDTHENCGCKDAARLLNAIDAALDTPELTDHQHGDLNFMDGWAAAIKEVHTRINEHLGEP